MNLVVKNFLRDIETAGPCQARQSALSRFFKRLKFQVTDGNDFG